MRHFEVLETKDPHYTTFKKLVVGSVFVFDNGNTKVEDITFDDLYVVVEKDMTGDVDITQYYSLAQKKMCILTNLFDWKVIKLKIDTLIVRSA